MLNLIPENNRLRFSFLTNFHKKKLLNGCGPKGGWIEVPDFIFTACCNHHDFKYWRGRGPSIFSFEFWIHPIKYFKAKTEDRLRADVVFKQYMISDACSYQGNIKESYITVAHTYYNGVRNFGWLRYNWLREKTKEDLPTEK